jgi:hypothetical protein
MATRPAITALDGGPALARALKEIDRAFANPHGGTLRRARDALRLGAAHPGTRARYGRWADAVRDRRLDLAGALIMLERAYRSERARHARSRQTWGTSIRPRLDLMILGELRLLARWQRRHAAHRFPALIDALTTPAARPVVAAE